MKNCIRNMKAQNGIKKADSSGKVRSTINIADDLHPEHSEKVRTRMRERRAASFSNYIEILMAEDAGLKTREAVPA